MNATTKTAHTPGPWTAHDDDGTGTLPCVLANQVTAYGNFYVAQCNNYSDARLIAAAPAMYEALHIINNQSLCPDWTAEQAIAFVRAHAKQAIAKAEGQPVTS